MPRKLCNQCLRPQNVCLCESLVHLQAPCKVLILQHPSEQKQPLATVPILQLCLSPIQVLVGEDFNEHPVVNAVLKDAKNVRVLFPAEQSASWRVGQGLDENEQVDTLIVLDGTWRKAKKMWFINEWLHSLPAVVLVGAPESQYQIRSSTIAGGVSTLEAIALSCNFLEGSTQFNRLYEPFKAMIDMQITKMGQDVFQAHYQKTQD
jgi:DTW domain-containing protein YfiP